MDKRIKPMVFVSLTAGLLIYAVPRLETGQGWSWPTVFAVTWIGFSLLVIAAHLHLWLGVDEAETKRLERIRRARNYRLRQRLIGDRSDLPRAYRRSPR